jgi:hypothetical protein
MNRYTILLGIYSNLDKIYLGILLASFYLIFTGYIVEYISNRTWKILTPAYWGLVIVLYVSGILLAGTHISGWLTP